MKKTSLLIIIIIVLVFLSAGTMSVLLFFQQLNSDLLGNKKDRPVIGDLSYMMKNLHQVTDDAIRKAEIEALPKPADHIIAHRGSSGESLEHSFTAYDEAIAKGVTNIEQDIVISGDGTLYVSHDQDAGRLTGDGRSFSSMSDDQIDSLTTRAGNRILRLSDVFDKYQKTVTYIIELKSSDSDTVQAFSKLVDSYGMADHITAQCQQLDALQSLDEIYPNMPKMYVCKTSAAVNSGYDKPYVDIVSIRYNLMDTDTASRIKDAGKVLSAWTLDSEGSIRKAIDLGVEIYFTDNIDRALALEEEYRSTAPKEATQNTDPSTIFFASDYQKVQGWPDPGETLAATLKSAEDNGHIPNRVVLCGDYTNDRKLHDYQLSPEESISDIKNLIRQQVPSAGSDDMIFVQGNHDQLTDSIASSGAHEYADCIIYVINTENDFPWKQGKTGGCLARVEKTSRDMKSFFDSLISRGDKRPVLIAGHVPLHFTARTSSRHTTGDNLYSSLIFSTVNEAAKKLDIVYFFGHNHSKGWDCYMGGSSVYKAVGDTVLIPSFVKTDLTTDKFTEERLNFTYLNAGYVGYYMNCGPEEADRGLADSYAAADGTLTSTVCRILPDGIQLTRYSSEGVHPLGWKGTGDPYRNGIDTGLIDEMYYSKRTDGPVTIKRRNL